MSNRIPENTMRGSGKRKRPPFIEVEHGFVILRSNGSAVDGHLYASRQDAATVVAFLSGCTVAPARRVSSFRKASTTTLALRSEIIIDRKIA